MSGLREKQLQLTSPRNARKKKKYNPRVGEQKERQPKVHRGGGHCEEGYCSAAGKKRKRNLFGGRNLPRNGRYVDSG